VKRARRAATRSEDEEPGRQQADGEQRDESEAEEPVGRERPLSRGVIREECGRGAGEQDQPD
jgi:hypothetical protein